jgi:hypothetical protein
VLVHIRPVFEEFAHNFVPGPGCGLYARFYQAEPAPVVGTTKCPESLCLMSALPSSGRRVPPPPRTLLPGHRSYRLMRQSRVALPYFGFWPRSWSLRRLLPAPAATGILPTLFLRILPQMPEPIPRRFAECVCLVLPQHSSAFPIIRLGRLPASFREHDFSRVGFRGCSYFIMFRPPSLLASQIVPTAASFPAGQPRLFTSEQNVRRYLRTHRTCYPPDNRQLAERELSSRKIRSLVGCYRMMPPFPWSPLSSVQRVFPSTAGRSVDQTVHLPVVYEEISYRAVGIRPSCTSLPVASYPRSESGDALR